MPFGLSNVGASFCHLMEMCLGDQQYLMLLFYLDDICIFSSSIDEMLDRIAMVLYHLKEFNLKIKPKKLFFFQSNVLFLGHIMLHCIVSPKSAHGMILYTLIVAVIGLLVFNVVLEVFINFTNINSFYAICVCVYEYVCMSVD